MQQQSLACHCELGAASRRNQECLLKKQDIAPLRRSEAISRTEVDIASSLRSSQWHTKAHPLEAVKS